MATVLSKDVHSRRMLTLAYGGLVLLAVVDALVGPIRIGILSIIPLLFIGFYGSRVLALLTALICAGVFSALDNDVITPTFRVQWTVPTDAVFMAVILVAVLWTVDRLRKSETAAASDSLTDLVSRRAFLQRLDRSVDRARRLGTRAGLLFVDLDGFKLVNDRFGHAVGDRLLRHVAQRLLHTVRAVDCVARYGGDEFLVLLEDVPDREHTERVARAVEAVLSAPFSNGEAVPRIGATVGAGLYPIDADEGTALIRVADERMYERKQRKRTSNASA